MGKVLKFERKKSQEEIEKEVQDSIDEAVRILRQEFDRDQILRELEAEDEGPSGN